METSQPAAEGINLKRFTVAYIKSMRLYYAFVTGIAGWIGVSFYSYMVPGGTGTVRNISILILLFLSWGINQIINDYLGLPEDRINAPNRPMVTGELDARLAVTISSGLMLGVMGVSWFLNPWSVLAIALGVLLNVLYEYAKAWSLLGNLIFGLSIAMCTIYGFLASGPVPSPAFTTNRFSVFILITVMNGLMTYFTYFKDYTGDKAAGKATFIVRHGLETARIAGVLGAFLPTILFFFFLWIDWIPKADILYTQNFIFCGVMTIFLQFWTALLYYLHPLGKRTYFSLVTNIRACVAGQVTLIAIFNGTLALYLFAASYVFIGFLFDLYKDAKS